LNYPDNSNIRNISYYYTLLHILLLLSSDNVFDFILQSNQGSSIHRQ